MKQIIIFLLLIIVFLLGYNQYKKHKRFNPPEYEYQPNENIDIEYHDHSFLLDYYQAIEKLNGYVIEQWGANGIDVRNPKKDNKRTQVATDAYRDRLGNVKYYEAVLTKSNELKKSGLTNMDIQTMQLKGNDIELYNKLQNQTLIKKLFNDKKTGNQLVIGDNNSLVFEIQKLLKNKGYDIPVDGIFKQATFDAIKSYEEKQGLYPDGKLDLLTLEHLLK